MSHEHINTVHYTTERKGRDEAVTHVEDWPDVAVDPLHAQGLGRGLLVEVQRLQGRQHVREYFALSGQLPVPWCP